MSTPVLVQRTLEPDNLSKMNDEQPQEHVLEISVNDMANLTSYMTTNGTSGPTDDLTASPLVVTALVVTIIGIQASLLLTCRCFS